MFTRYLLAGAALVFLTLSTATALDPIGGEFRVPSAESWRQDHQHVAMAPDGQFVVVYYRDYDLFGQLYSADAEMNGPEFQVNQTPNTVNCSRPRVSMDNDGNFVVVWFTAGYASPDSGHDVLGRRFTSSGNPVGDEFLVNSHTPGAQEGATVGMSSTGSFVVTWRSRHQDPNAEFGVFAQRFDQTGQTIGVEFQVNEPGTGAIDPSIVMTPPGGFAIVWRELWVDRSHLRIYDVTGTPLDAPQRVDTDNNSGVTTLLAKNIAVNAAGEFVVNWRVWDPQEGPRVYWQRFDSQGIRIGSEYHVNPGFPVNDMFSPSAGTVAMAPDGNFVVTWASDDAEDRGIYARVFSSTGGTLGDVFRVNTTTVGSQFAPVAAMANDRLVIVWLDRPLGTATTNVVGQRYGLPEYACDGFDPPIADGPVTVKNHRTLPFKAKLYDSDSLEITDHDVDAHPVIQVLYDSGIGDAIDVTAEVLPQGLGTMGNAFEYTGSRWQFNLESSNYSSTGTYTVSILSGDSSEYSIAPPCVGTFVID